MRGCWAHLISCNALCSLHGLRAGADLTSLVSTCFNMTSDGEAHGRTFLSWNHPWQSMEQKQGHRRSPIKSLLKLQCISQWSKTKHAMACMASGQYPCQMPGRSAKCSRRFVASMPSSALGGSERCIILPGFKRMAWTSTTILETRSKRRPTRHFDSTGVFNPARNASQFGKASHGKVLETTLFNRLDTDRHQSLSIRHVQCMCYV